MDELTQLESALAAQIDAANDEAAIEAVRVAALGKKGSISEKLKSLGSMSPEERQSLGPAINGLKNRITEALTARKTMLKDAAITARLATEKGRRDVASACVAGRTRPHSSDQPGH